MLGWMLLLSVAVSCAGPIEKSRPQEENSGVQPKQEVVSSTEAEFRCAMERLKNGDFSGARKTLIGIRQREDGRDAEPEVTFALGVLKLLDMETLEQMRGCRNYFQTFVDAHPEGPYLEDSKRIVRILNIHIRRAYSDRKRIRDLARQVNEQEQVIHTLRYKIEKLEEISRETEQKRHLLKGE